MIKPTRNTKKLTNMINPTRNTIQKNQITIKTTAKDKISINYLHTKISFVE